MDGSIDRSIDEEHQAQGGRVGLPLAFICLDSRYRVSILRGIDRGYRAGVGLFSIDTVADRS